MTIRQVTTGLRRPLYMTAVLLTVVLVPACAPDRGGTDGGPDEGPDGIPGSDADGAILVYDALADLLVERMSLQPGEGVFLLGEPGRFDPLAEELMERITRAGAEYLGAISVSGVPYETEHQTEFTRAVGAASTGANADPGPIVEILRAADLGIMLPGATAGQPVYSAMQDVLREDRGRTIHFHWQGAYSMDGRLLVPDADIDVAYQSSLLETDYDALGRDQLAFESTARTARIRVTTPAGTDLSFEIRDRPVTRQDGDVSAARMEQARNLIDREVELPAGALRVAPIEETVQGTIAFPAGVWNDQPVEGLVMRFEDGTLVEWSAGTGAEAVRAELAAAGPAGQRFREFALGFNPTLAIPTDRSWIPYYGYGAGVVRLSLGDNTELGGAVGGGYVRWNFFTDATVSVGDRTWVVDGRLQVPS